MKKLNPACGDSNIYGPHPKCPSCVWDKDKRRMIACGCRCHRLKRP